MVQLYSVLPWKAVCWLVVMEVNMYTLYTVDVLVQNSLRAAGGEFKFHS